jgi:hypothetical protein
MLLGLFVVAKPTIAVILIACVLGAVALSAPTAVWVGGALVSVLTLRFLVSYGVLPGVVTFMDFPFAWGALAVALIRSNGALPETTKKTFVRLGMLGGAVAASMIATFSAPLRGVLDFLLLGEPFAIYCALLIDPPTTRQRHLLKRLLLGLAVIQLPVALWQFMAFGKGDHVQGLLAGTGAGAHVVAACCAVAGMWVLSRPGRRWLAVPLLIEPFLADAKQVVFALAFGVVVAGWKTGRVNTLIKVAVVGGGVLLLILNPFFGMGSSKVLHQTDSGKAGKQPVAHFLWSQMLADKPSLLFGKGPANTVSRAAFMTVPGFVKSSSAVEALHLKPAPVAINAEAVAAGTTLRSSGPSSVNSALSSMLGVFGDLGFLGLAAYALLFASIFFRVRKIPTPEAAAATTGLAMLALLGVVFDWWEEPPFTLFTYALAALAVGANAATGRSAVSEH